MVRQFFSGFTGIIKSIGIVIICLAACAGLCILFVWPVWYFSQNHPTAFTTLVISFFLMLIIYAVVRKIRSGIKNSPDKKAKKSYLFKLTATTVRVAVFIVLLVLSVQSVLSGNRMTGIIVFAVSLIVFGFSGSLARFIANKIRQ
ncbi:MAG: hypothetical protein K5930_04505 [Treponemataceae bacterium]|nr:hypothetical protein [Treponemataceae bacterium]